MRFTTYDEQVRDQRRMQKMAFVLMFSAFAIAVSVLGIAALDYWAAMPWAYYDADTGKCVHMTIVSRTDGKETKIPCQPGKSFDAGYVALGK